MFARAKSGIVIGIDAREVIVESNVGGGLPGIRVIGLARGAMRESMPRVRAALHAMGITLKGHKSVINLLPAELPKETSALDLALAAATLATAEHISQRALAGRRFVGELSLSGSLEPIRGAIILADLARRQGDREILVPIDNAEEAAVVPGIRVIGVRRLSEMIAHLRGEHEVPPSVPRASSSPAISSCLSEVRGQLRAKRALEIAAAGGHNLLMLGPPGSGKTMLARRFAGILPELDADEAMEVTRIHSAAALTSGFGLIRERPFRAPHHTASEPALCGGGSVPRPGEITLAHRGVLFLDELPEFSRRALESLREPLEEGSIHIARANWSLAFPAQVLLVAAMNPCPCGRFRGDDPNRQKLPGQPPCMCSFDQISRYRGRISGPLLDRIDLHLLVDAVPYREYSREGSGEPSDRVRARVIAARGRQSRRLGQNRTNSVMNQKECRTFAPTDATSTGYLQDAIDRHGLSARAATRIIKVARTIADLEEESDVVPKHIREAIDYRILDRSAAMSDLAA